MPTIQEFFQSCKSQNSILFHFFLWKKKRNPKKSHRRTCSAKNQLRSLKALKCHSFVSLTLSSQGTNAFLTLTPLIFLTHRSSVGTFCFPTLSYCKPFPFQPSTVSTNATAATSQMSVKKIFERNVKNSRLGGVDCGERHPREFSGVRRFLAKMRRRRRSLVTFCR